MELTDKPSCVRYGLSIPLDKYKDGKVILITKPFGLRRRKINNYRREIKDVARRTYFCPLNSNTNHFTLIDAHTAIQEAIKQVEARIKTLRD